MRNWRAQTADKVEPNWWQACRTRNPWLGFECWNSANTRLEATAPLPIATRTATQSGEEALQLNSKWGGRYRRKDGVLGSTQARASPPPATPNKPVPGPGAVPAWPASVPLDIRGAALFEKRQGRLPTLRRSLRARAQGACPPSAPRGTAGSCREKWQLHRGRLEAC